MAKTTSERWHRGHPIIEHDGAWYYADNGQPVAGPPRECGECGQPNTPEGHDACLGTLPGVMNACCGHGDIGDAYVQFPDGRKQLDGRAALGWCRECGGTGAIESGRYSDPAIDPDPCERCNATGKPIEGREAEGE